MISALSLAAKVALAAGTMPPPLPAGHTYVTDEKGRYLTDANGAYLYKKV